jgi:PAS domain-containing protein
MSMNQSTQQLTQHSSPIVTILTSKVYAMNPSQHEQPLPLHHHLQTLHHMSLELSKVPTLDDLYRRAVEFGFNELGFDRLGLFILNLADNTWTGTFGIDSEGNIRDERSHTEGLSVLVKLLWHDLTAKHDQVILRDDVVLYDSGNEIGIGWHGIAALWKGNDIFGLLFIDNAISQKPQRDYEHDLISLFSSTLAHLITRKEVEDELRVSQKQYRDLFENVPVVLLVEDYSAVKVYIDQLKDDGISDFREFFTTNRDAVSRCANLIKIIDANQAALDLYGVTSKHRLSRVLSELLTDNASIDLLRDQFITLAEGNLDYRDNFNFQDVSGRKVDLDLKLRIAPDAEQTWSHVYVTMNQVNASNQ